MHCKRFYGLALKVSGFAFFSINFYSFRQQMTSHFNAVFCICYQRCLGEGMSQYELIQAPELPLKIKWIQISFDWPFSSYPRLKRRKQIPLDERKRSFLLWSFSHLWASTTKKIVSFPLYQTKHQFTHYFLTCMPNRGFTWNTHFFGGVVLVKWNNE